MRISRSPPLAGHRGRRKSFRQRPRWCTGRRSTRIAARVTSPPLGAQPPTSSLSPNKAVRDGTSHGRPSLRCCRRDRSAGTSTDRDKIAACPSPRTAHSSSHRVVEARASSSARAVPLSASARSCSPRRVIAVLNDGLLRTCSMAVAILAGDDFFEILTPAPRCTSRASRRPAFRPHRCAGNRRAPRWDRTLVRRRDYWRSRYEQHPAIVQRFLDAVLSGDGHVPTAATLLEGLPPTTDHAFTTGS